MVNAKDLYSEGDLGVKVVETPGSRIDGKYLGLYKNGTIYIPSFDDVRSMIKGWARRKYDVLIDDLKDYILGHEYHVEKVGMPANDEEHAALEANYLRKTMNPVGIATHGLRLENGGKSSAFSGMVSKYMPDLYSRYVEMKKYSGDLVDSVGKVLGLRDFEPEEVYA